MAKVYHTAPLLTLALCLALFYGPLLLLTGSVLTSAENDNVGHMLISLGDKRPGGQFFHYFDLSANARLWGQDLKYHPLHLIRWISIVLGATPAAWGLLIIGVHALLFLVVYRYSRALFRVSPFAALTGALVTFFSISWLEWTALVYWTAGVVLLAISIGEYALFLRTQRRRHLVFCILANAAQAYVTQANALIPAQAYLAGTILLMAYRRKGERWAALSPFLLRVLPLTALAWIAITAPMLFVVGSGLAVRNSLHAEAWGFRAGYATELLGLLFPVPDVVGDLLIKKGWLSGVIPPNNFLFGSFLFLPAIGALWRSGQAAARALLAGTALYLLSVTLADMVSVPSPMIRAVGFARLFAFPLLSGIVVAAAMDLSNLRETEGRGSRILHGFYKVLLGCALLGFALLLAVNDGQLTRLAERLHLLGSGVMIRHFLLDSRVHALGIALGLTGYFWLRRSSFLAPAALFLTILSPALCHGIGQGWYEKSPGLDAMISPPAEFQFLREQVPNYEYRVGFALAPELHLADGDWKGFWAEGSRPEQIVLSSLREHDLRLRQGLAFALPALHFYAPVHNRLREEGNPFLARLDSPEAYFLNQRNVTVRPEVPAFEEYGIRYWLSNLDLEQRSSGKFRKIFQGKTAMLFENAAAQPVVYFLDDPKRPMPLGYAGQGISVEIPKGKEGILSVHLDLRQMRAQAMDANAQTKPLSLQESGPRWTLKVPPGSTRVLFMPKELPGLQLLGAAAGAGFLVSLLWVGRP